MEYGKYEHLYQKTKNESKTVKRIEKIETQDWKVGYFILMGSFLLTLTYIFAMHKPGKLVNVLGWEANLALLFLFPGAIIAGFVGPNDFTKSTLMAAITITMINYLIVIIYEVYPGVATEKTTISMFTIIIFAGIPTLGFSAWIYPLFFCFVGSKIWHKVTNRFPRYV